MNILYKDEHFLIIHNEKYCYVPGFLNIISINDAWDESIEKIEKIARLEQTIRKLFLELDIQIVGLYREEDENEDFTISIIPFHVKQLEFLGISPDMFQPYIEKYLNSFDISFIKEVKFIDEKVSNALKNYFIGGKNES